MKEITGNLWDYLHDGYIVITTNGALNARGECVMGRGTALQAKQRFRGIGKQLGSLIRVYGNHANTIHTKEGPTIITFPVKHHWEEAADPELISRSVDELLDQVRFEELRHGIVAKVFMPRPGCGNGQLHWDSVRPILASRLDDRFTIVEIHP